MPLRKSRLPTFTVSTASMPCKVGHGDALFLDGRGYTVRGFQPDGTGMTVLRIEVDLVAGEDGVSPGQACVFYDAPEGQARVLGGGVDARIQSSAWPCETPGASENESVAALSCWKRFRVRGSTLFLIDAMAERGTSLPSMRARKTSPALMCKSDAPRSTAASW